MALAAKKEWLPWAAGGALFVLVATLLVWAIFTPADDVDPGKSWWSDGSRTTLLRALATGVVNGGVAFYVLWLAFWRQDRQFREEREKQQRQFEQDDRKNERAIEEERRYKLAAAYATWSTSCFEAIDAARLYWASMEPIRRAVKARSASDVLAQKDDPAVLLALGADKLRACSEEAKPYMVAFPEHARKAEAQRDLLRMLESEASMFRLVDSATAWVRSGLETYAVDLSCTLPKPLEPLREQLSKSIRDSLGHGVSIQEVRVSELSPPCIDIVLRERRQLWEGITVFPEPIDSAIKLGNPTVKVTTAKEGNSGD